MAEIIAATKKATYKTIEHHIRFTYAEFTDKTTEIIDIYTEGEVFETKINDKPSLEISIRQALQTQKGHEMFYCKLGPLG